MEIKQTVNESVGHQFSTDLLSIARNKTLAVIEQAREFLSEGLSENEMISHIESIQNSLGAQRAWHKPQVRFGSNTTKPFGVPGITNNRLKKDDIVFLDLGLVFEDHEGDVGRPFAIGNNKEMQRCCHDAEVIWHKTQAHWSEQRVTGAELYRFAEHLAQDMGWDLARKQANGHRISDFPHIVKNRKATIDELEICPSPDRWILEIQILDKGGRFGAFYEDLLNESSF